MWAWFQRRVAHRGAADPHDVDAAQGGGEGTLEEGHGIPAEREVPSHHTRPPGGQPRSLRAPPWT